MKTLTYILIAIAIIIFGTVMFASTLVESAIEKIGSQALGTEVTVGDIDLSLTQGLLEINNLAVANPKGFKNKNAISVRQIKLRLDSSTIMDDVIVIKEILINEPNFTVESNITTSNIKQLKKNVAKFTQRTEKAESSSPITTYTTSANDDSQKVKITKVDITNGNAKLVFENPVEAQKAEVKIANIHLRDIGGHGGISFEDAIGKIIAPLMLAANKSATGLINDASVKGLKDKAKGMVKDARKVLQGLFN